MQGKRHDRVVEMRLCFFSGKVGDYKVPFKSTRKCRSTADYYAQKAVVQKQIRSICHSHHGVDGYRSMTVYLKRAGNSYSAATIHKYMNTQMGLRSIVRPKKPGTKPGKSHKVFENK